MKCKLSPVVACLVAAIFAQDSSAGWLLDGITNSSGKACDSTPDCHPRSCRPKIVRPCVYHDPACNPNKPLGCAENQCDVSGCAPVTVDSCDSSGIAGPAGLSKLIRQSYSSTSARERRQALHWMSLLYRCDHYPQVMPTLVYALNDADERVRAKAADGIGDQLRAHPQCCNQMVLSALTHSLGDCDKFVRAQSAEALRAAGYDVVDGCCKTTHVLCQVPCRDACDHCVSGATSAPVTPQRPAAAPPAAKEAVPPVAAPAAVTDAVAENHDQFMPPTTNPPSDRGDLNAKAETQNRTNAIAIPRAETKPAPLFRVSNGSAVSISN
ncbi:HEAT repeat domain-containing protein [Planctomicrobium sp. SH668]|uniref:HEAT repeat domain-containing protein n=1 Tax=Planctomicrobium sp. SH668 TaxID=3448126 RepID=UPI003F5B2247